MNNLVTLYFKWNKHDFIVPSGLLVGNTKKNVYETSPRDVWCFLLMYLTYPESFRDSYGTIKKSQIC